MMKLALIGSDVKKSMSRNMHEFIVKKLKGEDFEFSYEHISIKEDEFDEKIEEILKTFDGLNITKPYKIRVIKHLEKLCFDGEKFGSINTIKCAGRLGYNTDGIGFLKSLELAEIDARNKDILVLGAGGATRSVVRKLKDLNSKITIYNRSFTKAYELNLEIGGLELLKELKLNKNYDIIINTTSVGMGELESLTPCDADIISRCDTAIDLIYNPKETKFLSLAKTQGKRILNGEMMLFFQAYFADLIFLNLEDKFDAIRLFNEYKKEENRL